MPNQPLMNVIAGNNGAGKSTITAILLQHLYLGEVIDADAIAKELNAKFPEQVGLSAGREVLRRVKKCINTRRDFCIETTLSGGNAIRQMYAAKQSNFEITLYYVGLPSVELHISRVAARVRAGGHFIAEQVIRDRYDRSIRHVSQALSWVDHAVFIDNSLAPTVVLQWDSGITQYAADPLPNWITRIDSLKHWVL